MARSTETVVGVRLPPATMPRETPPTPDCPPDTVFAELLEGRLPEPEAARLRTHVGACDGCRDLLDALSLAPTAGAALAGTGDAVVRELVRSTRRAGVDLSGATIDRKYRLIRLLGKGGMGAVYEADHAATRRRVAVKLLHAHVLAESDDVRRRFQREARAASAVDSPHIVAVLDAGEDHASGALYLVMELLPGEDLQHLIDRVGPIAPEAALGVAAQALAGLEKAHAAGIVHRDIKPANLFLVRGPGGEITVKLLDFGIAKVTSDTLATTHAAGITDTGGMLGSPLYMSPEQVVSSKHVDHRTDLWSLGSALYCALTGRAPFRHIESVGQLVLSICGSAPPPVRELAPWVPPEVAELVHRALAIEPADRPEGADAMLDAVRALLPGSPALREEMLAGVPPEVQATARASLRPGGAAPEAVAGSGPRVTSGATPVRLGPRADERPARSGVGRRVLLAGAGAALSLLAVDGYLRWRPRKAGQPVTAAHRRVTFRGNAAEPSFSPDGKWLAYTAGKKVVVRDVASGAERDVYEGQGPQIVQWSNGGKDLSFMEMDENRSVTRVVPREGGAVHTLERRGFQRFSRDGKEIVAWRYPSKGLDVFDVGATADAGPPSRSQRGTIPIAGDYTFLHDVAWSPSGDWFIVMTSKGESIYTLWSLRRDGSLQRRLFEEVETGSEDSPSIRWSPSDEAFYVLRAGPTGTRELAKVAFDPRTGQARGKGTVLLTGLDATMSFSVAPDGRCLSYVRKQDRSSLWLLSRGGAAEGFAKPRRLDAGVLPKQALSVSPDGREVAFAQVDSSANVFTIVLEGGTPKQVSSLPGAAAVNGTAWSPGGAEIAFTATLKDGSSRLYVVPAGGGEARGVGKETPGNALGWSPGRRLVYQMSSNRNYGVLDPVSLAEARLWSTEAGWAFYPRISPDGERAALLWNRDDEEPYGLWTVSLADGSPRSARFVAPGVVPLGYDHDARTIYGYAPMEGPIRELFEVPAGGGAPVRLGAVPFERPVSEIALVPGAPSFVCVVSEADSDIWFVEGFDPDVAAR